MDPRIKEAAAFVRARGFDRDFDAAFVLGTGLEVSADELEGRGPAGRRDPAFPESGVSGHAGRLVAQSLEAGACSCSWAVPTTTRPATRVRCAFPGAVQALRSPP